MQMRITKIADSKAHYSVADSLVATVAFPSSAPFVAVVARPDVAVSAHPDAGHPAPNPVITRPAIIAVPSILAVVTGIVVTVPANSEIDHPLANSLSARFAFVAETAVAP